MSLSRLEKSSFLTEINIKHDMQLDEVKKEIQYLVAKGQTKQAIEKLLFYSDQFDDETKKDIIINSSRLNIELRAIRTGVDDENTSVSINKINASILEVLDNIEPQMNKNEVTLKNGVLLIAMLGMIVIFGVWRFSKSSLPESEKGLEGELVTMVEEQEETASDTVKVIASSHVPVAPPVHKLKPKKNIEVYYEINDMKFRGRPGILGLSKCINDIIKTKEFDSGPITVRLNKGLIPKSSGRFSFAGGKILVEGTGFSCDLESVQVGQYQIGSKSDLSRRIVNHIDSSLLLDLPSICKQVVGCIN